MSSLLAPDNYASVRPLFGEMAYHLAVQTVLGGVLPGKVYVDDPASPATAILIPSNQHRVYVSGSPEQTMLEDVIRLLFEQSRAESYGMVLYYDASDAWQETIEQVLEKQESAHTWRQFYRLNAPSGSSSEPLPDHISIGSIDEAMVADDSLENSHLLREEVCSENPSLEHFFRKNFGFAAQDGRKLVAWCLGEYRYQGRVELGIETIEAYQRQGIATHLASAVIQHAFAEGAEEVGWHCWAKNTPSVATALKLGFQKVLDYPVYYCDYCQVSG